ncbi:MAG: bifunctional protein-serine/threonine kinase/phosphatase [Gammaproteobacteria bacterium]|nr:bifunctional protein-serine/threonine kinase/phosphatase [Gammaproteobacteria bacterium]MCW8959305.1 bifunctional protein-serine/threonine kinase/phosphatase [Gammaproteobacteria bacterium]MCW8972681.1 bifunctional protein-serine/threonine kinase/phosphatase [Gammaproteobacteria bacterium]MCW8992354.1 bifunctional protein-serine/threonine kinase/phosphatase [Gammaproteobacteria bacterium]
MTKQLRITIGQHSDRGRKAVNQDFHAASIPNEPLLSSKGIAVALADGISTSGVSQIASETSVKGFLEDYFSTPESWSVKTSVQRVLRATNSWLYAQTRNGPNRYEMDRGYVCTFSALVLKSTTAHIFHAGDTRVYRLIDNRLEQLTEDHRLWVSREKSYLSRALGMRDRLEIDYRSHALEIGDTFVLATDGVYEFAQETFTVDTIHAHSDNLDRAARAIVEEAYHCGSMDNLSIQIVRIDELPHHNIDELHQQATALPFPPELRPRMTFDGYEIVRDVHNSSRSHVYLAVDIETGKQVALKVPSIDLRNDDAYLERFLMEEWVARRIDNAHVLKPCELTRKRNYLYIVTEFIEGQTLSQWMTDNPCPDIETVRNIVEQIARGLRALHRQEMLHQDLRPNNIMIDKTGTVKIIDFGSVRVAGVAENAGRHEQQILGTAQYTAPEYFLGDTGTTRSDMFSLGVIAYQMLSGRLPYGTRVAQATTRAAQRKLVYASVLDDNLTIPAWVDFAIRKAVHPNPYHRYDEISEFIHDLRRPNRAFLSKSWPPLLERNPVLFWQGISLILLLIIVLLLSNDTLP